MKPEKIKSLIADNQIDAAILELQKEFKDAELLNSLIIQSNHWQDTKKKVMDGVITPQEEMLLKSRIIKALLDLIDRHINFQPLKELDSFRKETIEVNKEIIVPDQFLFKARNDKIKKRHRQRVSFILHLVTSNIFIRIEAPSGLPMGKLAKYVAGELFPGMKKQDFIWRFEKAEKEIPTEFELGALHFSASEVIYLTGEYEHKNFLPAFLTPAKKSFDATKSGTGIANEGGVIRARGEGRKVLMRPDKNRYAKSKRTKPISKFPDER